MGQGVLSAKGNRSGFGGYWHMHYLAGTQWYAKYRRLDSQTGRWLSRDPMGYVDGMAQYNYCANSPTSKIDPLGLLATATSTPCPCTNNEDSCPLEPFSTHTVLVNEVFVNTDRGPAGGCICRPTVRYSTIETPSGAWLSLTGSGQGFATCDYARAMTVWLITCRIHQDCSITCTSAPNGNTLQYKTCPGNQSGNCPRQPPC